jgi:hypothetical protein
VFVRLVGEKDAVSPTTTGIIVMTDHVNGIKPVDSMANVAPDQTGE